MQWQLLNWFRCYHTRCDPYRYRVRVPIYGSCHIWLMTVLFGRDRPNNEKQITIFNEVKEGASAIRRFDWSSEIVRHTGFTEGLDGGSSKPVVNKILDN